MVHLLINGVLDLMKYVSLYKSVFETYIACIYSTYSFILSISIYDARRQ